MNNQARIWTNPLQLESTGESPVNTSGSHTMYLNKGGTGHSSLLILSYILHFQQ